MQDRAGRSPSTGQFWSARDSTQCLDADGGKRALKKPPFKHVVRSRDANTQYSIYAHRPLTRAEIVATVRGYNDVKFHRPGDGNIEIITMIGYHESGRKQ
jgi:hypothetical protein